MDGQTVPEDTDSGKVEEILDKNGEKFVIVKYGDLVMPVVFKEKGGEKRLQYVKDYPYEDGDVLLCSYPKTGTHWTFHLLHFLRHEGPLIEAACCTPHFIDLPVKLSPTPPGARNVVSHFPPKYLPTEHTKPGRKIILVFRNPKDAAVSLYYALKKNTGLFGEFKLSWNCFLDNWMMGKMPVGSFFEYYNSWQKYILDNPDMDIHIINFEDLKRNGVYELRRICKYLGLSRTNERLQEVLNRCSLPDLKADVETGKCLTVLVDKDGKSTLYRKGIIGDWKNHFTLEQNERAETAIQEQFANSIFKYTT